MARKKSIVSKYCPNHDWRDYLNITGNSTLICQCNNCGARMSLKKYLAKKEQKPILTRNFLPIKSAHIDLFWS